MNRDAEKSASAAALWPTSDDESDLRVPWAAVAALTIVAAALRAIGLDGGLWYDEIRTLLDSAQQPLGRIVTVFPGNNQHTLYSVLAHASIQAFGASAWSLRLPALIFGAATVPTLYLFAREFAGRREALLACVLLTVSYHHVWFSQNARGYTAAAFFALFCSWLLLRGLRRGRAGAFLGYAVAAALAAYTHLTMVFLVVAHAIACVVLLGVPRMTGERWHRWRLPAIGFVLSAVLTLALYAPMLADVQQFFLSQGGGPYTATPLWAAAEMLRGLQRGATALGLAAGAALVACGLWSYFRQSRFLFALFVLPAMITVVAAIALWRIYPRFLFFLIGFGLLVVVRGALEVGSWVSRRWQRDPAPDRVTAPGVALVALLTLLSAASLPENYRYPKQDFEGAMQFVLARRAPADRVLTLGTAAYVYREYYKQPWESVGSLEALRKQRTPGGRLWLIYTLPDFIEAGARDLMNALRVDCGVAGVFRGTVAGGDVTVCVLQATSPLAQ